VSKGDIKIDGVSTHDQLADIFTKPLDESRFCKLRNELNVIDISNVAWELAHVFIHMHLFISLIYFVPILCFCSVILMKLVFRIIS
jgi:hypothetical protein